ncbi:hypothetical protein TNCV_387401 [Trichonephila clavipes]|nr:hypothetical protein TNCV_387401 [Trichonephila clavipes]
MVADWAGLVSIHAKPVEVYSQKVMSGSSAKAGAIPSALSRYIAIGPTVARVSCGFPKLFVLLAHGSIFFTVCGVNALCSSEGQGDFRLSQLGSLLGVLVGSFIDMSAVQPYEMSSAILVRH